MPKSNTLFSKPFKFKVIQSFVVIINKCICLPLFVARLKCSFTSNHKIAKKNFELETILCIFGIWFSFFIRYNIIFIVSWLSSLRLQYLFPHTEQIKSSSTTYRVKKQCNHNRFDDDGFVLVEEERSFCCFVVAFFYYNLKQCFFEMISPFVLERHTQWSLAHELTAINTQSGWQNTTENWE